MKLAHIINPFKDRESSTLSFVQSVTFQTMLHAKKELSGNDHVELIAACYPEDKDIVPEYFKKIILLTRSTLDLDLFQEKKKLPFIYDVLKSLYDYSNADYFIYTNSDIALKKDFYKKVCQYLSNGYDGLAINRRNISMPDEEMIQNRGINLEDLYNKKGNPHKGIDCIVFRKNIFPLFQLGNIFIGCLPIGQALLDNAEKFSSRFLWVKKKDLTFHLGCGIAWHDHGKGKYQDYLDYNRSEYERNKLFLFNAFSRHYLNKRGKLFHLLNKVLKYRFNFKQGNKDG